MIAAFARRKWDSRYGHIRFHLVDVLWLAYMGSIGFALLFFHRNVSHWPLHVLIHAAIVVAILEILHWAEKYPQKKGLGLLRTLYSMPLFLYAWEELEALVPMFFGNYWATEMIVGWDKLIFGVHPTVWMQNLYQPWLSELMHFIYMAYYSLFLVPLFLFIRGKNKETLAMLSLASLSYLSNFVIFYFLPVLDPPHVPLLQEAMTREQVGYFFVHLNQFTQSVAGISVGCFPSSHVAGALVWVLSSFRYSRMIGYIYAPVVLGIGFSTVYIQLHHAVDPIAGYIWGLICFLVGLKLLKKRGEDPAIP